MIEKKHRCPICGKPALPEFKPFCSRRCADLELGRWLAGAYAVPDDAESEGDEELDPEG
jgi:endogenous inhibitor of DNA gyrase (YacG/DUF329 family)